MDPDDNVEQEDLTYEHHPDLQALFQQHFEARFRPLEPEIRPLRIQHATHSPSISEEEKSDWEGLLEDAQSVPEMVELGRLRASSEDVPTEEMRSFMVDVHTQAS